MPPSAAFTRLVHAETNQVQRCQFLFTTFNNYGFSAADLLSGQTFSINRQDLTPDGMRGNELLFAKPVAIFLADLAHGFADFLQMLRHCTFYRIAITFLQGRENIKMLA